ncbi:MAG: class I SAM-dependent methyltransferase [Weeksellaceae bacterium]|nr:class I SAM-dependent methyltransferase [Weeksellaceae bacterium]
MTNLFHKLLAQLGISPPLDQAHPMESYWERKYTAGKNGGKGSMRNLGAFKASIVNNFISENNINSVIDWGCGQGQMVSMIKAVNYIGIDLSRTAIRRCKKRIAGDEHKQFLHYSMYKGQQAELSLSMDVLCYQPTQHTYQEHLQQLFGSSTKWVIIYAYDGQMQHSVHCHSRRFLPDIEHWFPDFELAQFIPNKYPFSATDSSNTSYSDFYIFRKKGT